MADNPAVKTDQVGSTAGSSPQPTNGATASGEAKETSFTKVQVEQMVAKATNDALAAAGRTQKQLTREKEAFSAETRKFQERQVQWDREQETLAEKRYADNPEGFAAFRERREFERSRVQFAEERRQFDADKAAFQVERDTLSTAQRDQLVNKVATEYQLNPLQADALRNHGGDTPEAISQLAAAFRGSTFTGTGVPASVPANDSGRTQGAVGQPRSAVENALVLIQQAKARAKAG